MDVMVPAEDGHWVNEKFARISEIINDFDPRLQLVWIPPENRNPTDVKPYGILHTADDGLQKMVMLIKEEELDERVLQQLFLNDTSRHDVLATMEAREIAEALVRNKEKMEKAAERQEFISSVVKSPMHSFKHKGRIIPK
jgi:hypothetical protein